MRLTEVNLVGEDYSRSTPTPASAIGEWVNLLTILGVLLTTVAWVRAGGVFWTDRGASQILRMNFDGTEPQVILLTGEVSAPGVNIRGIALDTSNNRMYWADNGADRLLTARLDGSASAILHTIDGGNSFPADVRLDPSNSALFWCDQLRNQIQRLTFADRVVTLIVSNAAPTGPYFMDLHLETGKVYWGDFDEGFIYRANPDGSNREILITGNNKIRGLKVDPVERMLYWVNRDDKKLHRCRLSALANGPITLAHPAVETLYSGLDTPHGLTLDIPARKLYWADTGSNAGSGAGEKAINRGDFDGRGPMEVLVSGREPWDVDLDLRCGSYVEWRWRCFRRDAASALTDPGADPDGDGYPNAVEYALDSSPLQPGAMAWLRGLVVSDPMTHDVYHALKFRRRTTMPDLVCFVQVSTNLTSWSGSPANPQTIESQIVPLANGLEEVTLRTLQPAPPFSPQFLRLCMVYDPSIEPH